MKLAATVASLLLSSGLVAGSTLRHRDLLTAACQNALDDADEIVAILATEKVNSDNAADMPEVDSVTWETKKLMITSMCQQQQRKLGDERNLQQDDIPVLTTNILAPGVIEDGVMPATGLDSLVQVASLPSDVNFGSPCYARPVSEQGFSDQGWTRVEFGDDQGVQTVLSFDFNFYGTTYAAGTPLWVNINGNVNFGTNQYPGFTALGFPIDGVAMIAPFWSDVDTSESVFSNPSDSLYPAYGSIWYKEFPNEKKFAVIWNEVGYYSKKNDRKNTFQLVMSDGTGLGGTNNACFCYLEMEWTTGEASGGVGGVGGFGKERGPATVGANSGAENQFFAQFGRFDKPGTDFDGAFGETDGVDYLDYRGAINALGGLCLDSSSPNVPPIVSGFPADNKLVVNCGQSVDLSLVFSAPELDQIIDVTTPAAAELPAGVSLVEVSVAQESVTIEFKWTPNSSQAGKTYEFDFMASDNYSPPGVVVQKLVIEVDECEMKCCEEIVDPPECEFGGPVCTPWRSPEYCPADESLPLLITTRRNSRAAARAAGYWYPLLDDRASAYTYTIDEGFQAPKLYCCVTAIDEVGSICFADGNSIPTGFVIRATNSHSSQGIFVFPDGFDGVEVISGLTMSYQDVVNKINEGAPPDKILVEQYINGPNGARLPAEYKFHVFNGQIGAISVVVNRDGADGECGCYAEVDADFNRLDTHGCFVPSMPVGKNDDGDQCYDIDKEAGKDNPYTIKGFDFCGDLTKPDDCAWEDMKAIALSLSEKIGVYMRIDMFLDANNQVWVQEYTENHNGGLRHCAAKEENGCINSCFLGQLWKATSGSNLTYGGPLAMEPMWMPGWDLLTHGQQCAGALQTQPWGPIFEPTC